MIYPIHMIVYIVIGITLGLTFSTLVIYDRAMDERIVALGLLTTIWLPVLVLTLVVGILWLLVISGDFIVRIARSLFKT